MLQLRAFENSLRGGPDIDSHSQSTPRSKRQQLHKACTGEAHGAGIEKLRRCSLESQGDRGGGGGIGAEASNRLHAAATLASAAKAGAGDREDECEDVPPPPGTGLARSADGTRLSARRKKRNQRVSEHVGGHAAVMVRTSEGKERPRGAGTPVLARARDAAASAHHSSESLVQNIKGWCRAKPSDILDKGSRACLDKGAMRARNGRHSPATEYDVKGHSEAVGNRLAGENFLNLSAEDLTDILGGGAAHHSADDLPDRDETDSAEQVGGGDAKQYAEQMVLEETADQVVTVRSEKQPFVDQLVMDGEEKVPAEALRIRVEVTPTEQVTEMASTVLDEGENAPPPQQKLPAPEKKSSPQKIKVEEGRKTGVVRKVSVQRKDHKQGEVEARVVKGRYKQQPPRGVLKYMKEKSGSLSSDVGGEDAKVANGDDGPLTKDVRRKSVESSEDTRNGQSRSGSVSSSEDPAARVTKGVNGRLSSENLSGRNGARRNSRQSSTEDVSPKKGQQLSSEDVTKRASPRTRGGPDQKAAPRAKVTPPARKPPAAAAVRGGRAGAASKTTTPPGAGTAAPRRPPGRRAAAAEAVPWEELERRALARKPCVGADYKDIDALLAEARSEEQVSAWLQSAEHVWLVHRAGFSAARRCPTPADSDSDGDAATSGKLRICLDATGDTLLVDEDDVEKANPPQFDRAEDLAHLRYLNESSVLHTLRQRYASNLIHTYAGPAMVVINPMAPLAIYSEKVVQMFRGCKSEDMPPHIYSLAQSAYRSMLASRRDQSIVLLGRSGSGKTTSFRHILHYLALAAGTVNKVATVEKLSAISSVMEAFGNARTVMNANATRFTQIFSLDFDQSGQIASASIQVLLAERRRVVHRPEGEPTFHIFYRMLAGVEGPLRKELYLDSSLSEHNLFMTPLHKHEDKQRAMQEFIRVCTAMKTLGITDAEAKIIWSVLAAIYHLGVAGAVKGGNGGRWQFGNPRAAQHAARLLGTSAEELGRLLFGQGTPPTPRQPFRTPSPTERDVTGIEALEGLVTGLYGEVFNAVAALVNRSISASTHTVSSIVLVDCPGFQNPASCGHQGGATFEDLCHNYLQERLQLLFHHTTLVAPRDRYAQEHIECVLEDEGESGSPAPMVSLLDRASQSAMVRSSQTDLRNAGDRRGLLWLLDEEAVFPAASDEGFLERLLAHYGDREHQLLLRKAPGHNQFVLQHLQGTNPVLYTATGWLKASRENPMVRNAATLLQESSKEEMSQLFVSIRGTGVSSTLGGSVVGIEGTQSLRRASSIRRTFTAGAAGIKRKSVCLQVKFTVDGLVETLRRTRLKFVHCFLPQHNAGLSDAKSQLPRSGSTGNAEDLVINVPLLRSQLRGAQLVEAVRLHKQGFPKFLPLSEFRRRFRLLAPPEARPTSPVPDERRAVEEMLLGIDTDPSGYRVGLSQIFFRSGVLAQLEAQRDERLTDHVVRLQAQCRGYLARRKLHKLKIQDLAVRCIQRNVRKFLLIRDWPWWRLLVRVTPLLNVHRTEEELRAKTEELEALRAKVEKLEQERTHLKHDTDRLEAKLSEMTADLAEEHSTATLATERLEAETAERLRLEKELSEVQYQKQNLQQTSERLEMELLCMRSAAEVNGLGSDDEGEGEDSSGSVYKQRYERAVRELEFTRRRLQQQHEDDLEQLVALKKQLEKKLADAYEEVEEQRQVVGQWKRKVQKLNAEMSDLRLLLEEQNSRNNLLEKKQRKFDSELQLLQDELRQEKQQKERISREKDLAIAEKYSLEQDLSGVRLELELKEEKVSALTQELDELTFGGKTEEEVAQLKKAKHELEKRLKEQEEELDELAGQVQLLEQAKLRLEMSLEQQRKESRREAAQRDEELEDARCAAHKKVKALEAQLESEHEERTALLRERHELERRLAAAEEMARAGRSQEEEQLQRLRRDLRRTKALLRDAQAALERARADSPGKALVRQLRNQLEDLEVARAAAVKARQTAELELSEVQAMLEEAQRSRSEAEDRAAAVARERSELRTQLEENEEELAEVLKKYRSTVQQLSAEQLALQEQAGRVSELESERASLREQLAELTTRLESMETLGDPSSSLTQRRLEMRTKELESKLELEQTTRARLEVQIARLKEAVERLQDEAAAARAKEQAAVDASRKLQRTVRELREEQTAAAARESEWAVRKRDLEKRLEASEAEAAAARQDLRLALTRIEDLQSAIRGELEDGEDSNDDENSDSAQDSDVSEDSMSVYLTNHKVHVNSSPRTTRASLELDITSRSLEVASLKKPNDSSGKESFA
ncbi:unconventional myosin-XVIIIa isoform X1 [Schistocerca gregaria]|uniref:unconventional myosin-XVIIIa isoform X1 n=1 Tax=Schistocerca gregaria TaxID=7010 RepID=UPI00211ED8C1|nr:unconventional myosin-XVIIIa isoform X1 [Schistocerca gregaria]